MHPTYVALHEVTRHGASVSTERAETAAVSRGTSHVTNKQRCKHTTTSVDIQNALTKPGHSFRMACDMSAVSLLESGEQRYVKAINNNNKLQALLYGKCRKAILGVCVSTSPTFLPETGLRWRGRFQRLVNRTGQLRTNHTFSILSHQFKVRVIKLQIKS